MATVAVKPISGLNPSRGHRRTVSTDIIERARLELIVPSTTNLDILNHLEQHGVQAQATNKEPQGSQRPSSRKNEGIPIAALSTVGQRSSLFYGQYYFMKLVEHATQTRCYIKF